MRKRSFISIFTAIVVLGTAGASAVIGQQITKTFQVAANARIEIVNRHGRVEAVTNSPVEIDEAVDGKAVTGSLAVSANSSSPVSEAELEITSSQNLVRVEVLPKDAGKRVDIAVSMPPKMRVKIETFDGEVRVSGDISSAEVRTDTGTIAVDVPTDRVKYSLRWTSSRPRYLSDFDLSKIREGSAGKFQISGTYPDKNAKPEVDSSETVEQDLDKNAAEDGGVEESEAKSKRKKGRDKSLDVSLDLETARGIILINVSPNQVSGDLRERPLTNAAKAVIRSGDSLLIDAIRRAAPKYFGDYTRTLPPLKLEPQLGNRSNAERTIAASVKVASVRVSDVNNRALGDLAAGDFEVLEGGENREVISVRASTAPFNLVLLLDVSGSVDNFVTFIRKAARSFVNTVDARDRISVVTFNDDVNVVAKFTTDKSLLSTSLDTFDAGGATAYYDALAYTLADTLRPLKGERTAIVILTDGDDNRSFLPFDSMLSSIQESGALIYPLYVPSGLIAASQDESNTAVDSLRTRYLQGELTSKAKGEGERLAKVSGGVYYEISRLSQIQTAYEDIVRQLRTAYEIEYRSELGGVDAGVSPRLRIRVKQPNTYVQIRSVEQRLAGK